MAALTACASRSMAKSRGVELTFVWDCKLAVKARAVAAKCCADIACLLFPLVFNRSTESMSSCWILEYSFFCSSHCSVFSVTLRRKGHRTHHLTEERKLVTPRLTLLSYSIYLNNPAMGVIGVIGMPPVGRAGLSIKGVSRRLGFSSIHSPTNRSSSVGGSLSS